MMNVFVLVLSLILCCQSAFSAYVEDVRPIPISDREKWRHLIDTSSQRIYPGVVVLSDQDYAKVKLATEQWARAAQRFAGVFYSDPKSLTSILPSALIDYWAKTYARRKVDPKQIHFIVGLDILRDDDGTLSIIEANTNVVSGIWTTEELVWPFRQALGSEFSNLAVLNRSFETMIASLSLPPGVIVNAQYDIYTLARMSDYARAFAAALPRVEELNWRNKIRTVYLGPLETTRHFFNSLVPDLLEIDVNHALSGITGEALSVHTDESGMYLRIERGSEIVRAPVNLLWPHLMNDHMLEYLPSVWRLFEAKKIALAQTPGIEILEDKLLLVYMGAIIRHFLGEEPILGFSQSTPLYDENGQYSANTLDMLAQHPEGWVVKPVAKQGGVGVILNDDLKNPEVRSRLSRDLNENPFEFVAQRKISSSVIPVALDRKRRLNVVNPTIPSWKIDFRTYAVANSVNGESQIDVLPLISSRGVSESARTHNVAGNLGHSTIQLILPEIRYVRSFCQGHLEGEAAQ